MAKHFTPKPANAPEKGYEWVQFYTLGEEAAKAVKKYSDLLERKACQI